MKENLDMKTKIKKVDPSIIKFIYLEANKNKKQNIKTKFGTEIEVESEINYLELEQVVTSTLLFDDQEYITTFQIINNTLFYEEKIITNNKINHFIMNIVFYPMNRLKLRAKLKYIKNNLGENYENTISL